MTTDVLRRAFESRDLRPLFTWRGRAAAWAERLRSRFLPAMEGNIARILWHKRSWRKLANFLLIEAQMGLKNGRVLGKPYWLTLDPTNFCQLRCPFCPTGAERKVRAKAILRFEDYKKLIDELGPTLLHIDFMNWGEPLLHREIFEMVAYAKKFGIDTHISTNLNEFNEAMAEKMVLSGLDAVTLSIDGLTQETYAKYRVRGDYDKVIGNLKTLVRKKKELGRRHPYVIWQFLVFKHNEHEVERARAFGKELGCDVVGVTPAFLPFRPGIKDEWLPEKPEHRYYEPASFPETPPWEWAGKDAEGNKVAEDHTPVPDSPNLRPKADAAEPSGEKVANATPVIDVKVYKEPEKRPLCNWPWAGIAINPNGSVSPCCSIEEDMYDFGNVFQRGFGKIWNGADYARSRRHVRDYVGHKTDVLTRSGHACERCFSVGRANFQFQPWWRFEQFDWWWGINGAQKPADPVLHTDTGPVDRSAERATP